MGKLFQVLFWVLAGVVLTIMFGRPHGGLAQSFYFVVFLMPVIIGTSYFFNHYLLPNYLLRGKYLKFALYFIYSLVISIYLEMLVLTGALVLLANYKYDHLNSKTTDVVLLSIILYFFVFINTIVILVNEYFKGQRILDSLEKGKVTNEKGYITVRSERRNANVLFEQIVYIESFSDYVKIHLTGDDAVVTKEKISNLHCKLPDSFIRIHRSFIVNRHHVLSFSKECVFVGRMELPVSRKYKGEAITALNTGR